MRLCSSHGRTRCLQVLRVALVVSLTLASLQVSAGTEGKERPVEYPDLLSHDTDRWALHLLQRGRPERRAYSSPAARATVFIADVRASLRPAFRSLSPCRARLPRLRTQRLAGPEEIRLHVRSLRRGHESLHRSARALALHALHAGLRRPGRVFAWPWPIRSGSRRSSSRTPWRTTKASGRIGSRGGPFGPIGLPTKAALRTNLLSLSTTRTRHVGNDPERRTL